METAASLESTLSVAGGSLLTVASPASVSGSTGYNVYASNASGQEALQNSTPIAIGTGWTEPTTGIVTGLVPPTSGSGAPTSAPPLSATSAASPTTYYFQITYIISGVETPASPEGSVAADSTASITLFGNATTQKAKNGTGPISNNTTMRRIRNRKPSVENSTRVRNGDRRIFRFLKFPTTPHARCSALDAPEILLRNVAWALKGG